MKSHFLLPGEIVTVREPALITTLLGSCVAVALHEKGGVHAGMNHYLLPQAPAHEPRNPRYGDFAIAELIARLLQAGARADRLEAKVFGGGAVVEHFRFGMQIGQLNTALALRLLGERKIPILFRDVGGTHARKIQMNTATFDIRDVQSATKKAAA